MARHPQDGLSYFSFDTDFFYTDNRVRALRARYGCDGLMIYIFLLTEIYREKGYYIIWNKDGEDNILAELNVSDGLIKQVLAFLVDRSLLESILVGSDTVYTSPGIQKRYQMAVKSLKRDVFVRREIWLLDEEKTATCIKFTQKQEISEKKDDKSENYSNKSGIYETKEKKGKEIKGNITVSEDTVRQTDVRRVTQAWNVLSAYGIKPVSKISSGSKRYESLMARIREYGIESVLEAIEKIKCSDFLQGKKSGKRQWIITFDWFVLPSNFPKVLEGNYSNPELPNEEGSINKATNLPAGKQEENFDEELMGDDW